MKPEQISLWGDPNIKPGKKLTHIPTGRPVEIIKTTKEGFIIRTLNDIWPHPVTRKPWGGSLWIMEWASEKQFQGSK